MEVGSTMRLEDKVAIVTGSGMGIGKGIAQVFAHEGAKVVLAEINSEAGEAAGAGLLEAGAEVLFVPTDVSDGKSVQAMVERTIDAFGGIDILVNNAGVGVYKSVLDTSLEDWDRCLDVNLKGVFLCSKYALPHMQARGKGSIVNIASVHAVATVAGVAPYAASKGGVAALTRNMAIDYGPEVRVNAIGPGWVLTPLIQGIFDGQDDPAAYQKLIEERQVMKRIGRPEDIGMAALYLAGDEASFVTGATLFVDGGLTAQLEVW